MNNYMSLVQHNLNTVSAEVSQSARSTININGKLGDLGRRLARMSRHWPSGPRKPLHLHKKTDFSQLLTSGLAIMYSRTRSRSAMATATLSSAAP